MLINTRAIDRLGLSLDASALRQNVIANNIANAETPMFKRSDVQFEELLQKELKDFKSGFIGMRTDPRHLVIGRQAGAPIQARIVTDRQSVMNNNENNVDIDYEMSLMAKNQLYYNTLIGQLNHDIHMTRTAIDKR